MYHDPCQSAIANNTVFHNYTQGIQVAGDPDNKWSGCASDDYNSVNNNLVVRNGYGCNVFPYNSHGAVRNPILQCQWNAQYGEQQLHGQQL